MNTPTQAQPKKRIPLYWGLVGLLVFLCLCLILLSSVSNDDKISVTETSAETPVEVSTNTPANTPIPTMTLEPRDALRARISEVLGSGNRDIPRVTEIVFDYPEAGDISVQWALNDNFTENLIRIGARNDATDILKAIAQSGVDFTYVTLLGTFSMQDKFGNVSEDVILTLIYSKATVDKINWVNFLSDNIYDIADTKIIHPTLRE